MPLKEYKSDVDTDYAYEVANEMFDDEHCCACCGNESAQDVGYLGEKCAKAIGDFFRVLNDEFLTLTEEQREYVLDNTDFNEHLKGLI